MSRCVTQRATYQYPAAALPRYRDLLPPVTGRADVSEDDALTLVNRHLMHYGIPALEAPGLSPTILLERISTIPGYLGPLGIKPEELPAGEHMDGVMYFKPPQGPLVIRLFPGNAQPSSGLFFLDFYHLEQKRASNSPRGYHLYVLHEKGQMERLLPLEKIFNMPNPLPEGHERFAISEGSICSFSSPEVQRFTFRIPTRTELSVASPIPMI
ncbi:hypothetical protein B0H14DRAFT_2701164 [Mycena olivaceomarginata]|nr:hypothetical protein B0H14DRAFT_2701164 [Mycena olivaceomarginata]